MRTILLTSFALIAFAANSVFCRLALHDDLVDAGSFTAIRLLSGVVMLMMIVALMKKSDKHTEQGSWMASIFLFLYAVTFSYAYISLDMGTGALILFGAGQITLISYAVWAGKRLNILEVIGLVLAGSGFVYLMLPSATTPSWIGFLLMSISGAAWACYTIIGKGSTQPLLETTLNFKRTLLMLIPLILITYSYVQISYQGALYAILSGAVASGIGYTVWYMAVVRLQTLHAAVVQLLVPIIAALAGIILIAEPITAQFTFSSSMVLGGILMIIFAGRKSSQKAKD